MKDAWTGEYVGSPHINLLESIKAAVLDIDKHTLEYANTLEILQSSGTGKSRMVHELAKLVFTIPFNLREASSRKNFCFCAAILAS